MALPGILWHYRTELTFPNSEAIPVRYRILGTASEAGVARSRRSGASQAQGSDAGQRIAPGSPSFSLLHYRLVGRLHPCQRTVRSFPIFPISSSLYCVGTTVLGLQLDCLDLHCGIGMPMSERKASKRVG